MPGIQGQDAFLVASHYKCTLYQVAPECPHHESSLMTMVEM